MADQHPPAAWSRPEENLPVPRWEVKQMIKDCVVTEIGNYERTIVAPRHAETQGSLAKLTEVVSGFKDVMTELNGGVKVLKFIGVALVAAIGTGGGIYAFARLLGHS